MIQCEKFLDVAHLSKRKSFMAYDVATKNLESADKNLEKLKQNFLVKKQYSLIVESLLIYVRVMNIYEYPKLTISKKTTEFKQYAKELGLGKLFDELRENN